MDFNNYWTKDINNLYREMIKEGKSSNEIRNHIDDNVLMHHPNKKFHIDNKLPLFKYNDFLNEIKIIPGEIKYNIESKDSEVYDGKEDYILSFELNDINYVVVLFYFIYNDIDSYNILFTTQQQYNDYIKIKGEKKIGNLTITEYIEISEILEKETNYNDIINVMKSLSFILMNFHNILKYKYNIPYSICETNNPVKIKLYRNIIKNSFDNITEKEDIMDSGKKIYYYYIKNKNEK